MRLRNHICVCLTLLATFSGAGGAQQPARDIAAKPSTGTGVISGTVMTDEPNGRPLRHVTLTMSAAGGGMTVQRVTSTDDAGRFAFTRLPAGNYAAPRANRPGFVPVTYGEKRVGGIGSPITLADGQRMTIAFKMLRGAVIAGTLLDQRNQPAVQTNIQATPVRIVNGERSPVQGPGSSATTDDQGTYRLYGLAPGDYVVSASPRLTVSGDVRPITEAEIQWAQQQLHPQGGFPTGGAPAPGAAAPPPPAQAVAYTPVYYPGTADVASATLVTVASGQERSGVDFNTQLVSTARITGTVTDQNGQIPQNAQLNLVSRADSSAMMVGPFFLLDAMMMTRPTVTNGKFSVVGVRPGRYTLTARASARPVGAGPAPAAAAGRGGGPGASAMTMWASTDITVDGTDQSGIVLRLEPGMTLAGRIAFEAVTLQPPADLSRVSIRLSAAPSPSGVTVSVNIPSAQAAADGTFKLEGVTPGRYFLSASAPAAAAVPGSTWVVRSAMVAGVDAADAPFEVKPTEDISNAVITFTDKTSEISGTVRDGTGHPTPEFSIILFSTDKTMWSQRSRRLKYPVRASTDGAFKFTNVLPGEYYLAALTDFQPNDYYTPAFLEQVALAAMKVTLAEGEKKVQDLKIAGLAPGSFSRLIEELDDARRHQLH